MDRYIGGYTGIRKMLKAVKAKLKMIYKSGKVQISAIPLVDYSQDKEWDSTQISAQISKNDFPNQFNVICLGKGELKEQKSNSSVHGCKRKKCQKHRLILAFGK